METISKPLTWAQKNPERATFLRKRWAENNKEKIKVHNRNAKRKAKLEGKPTWAQQHPQQYKEIVKRWNENNKDKRNGYTRKFHRKIRRNPKTWLQSCYPRIKKRATRKGWECSFDPKAVPIPEFCPVLGIKLVYGGSWGFKTHNAASLDRIDPTKVYVIGNVCVISWRANMLKRDGTLEEFRALVRYLETGGV